MITAYSRKYSRELDALQLAELEGYGVVADPGLAEISDCFRKLMYEDLMCPSCGAEGACLVKAGVSKTDGGMVTQPHFRFVAAQGDDAHSKYCEYSEQSVKKLVAPDQGSIGGLDRSDETRWVRGLICRAIEADVLSEADIVSFRRWYFDIRSENTVDFPLSVDELRFFSFLRHAFTGGEYLHLQPDFKKTLYAEISEDSRGFVLESAAGLVGSLFIDGSDRYMGPLVKYYKKSAHELIFDCRCLMDRIEKFEHVLSCFITLNNFSDIKLRKNIRLFDAVSFYLSLILNVSEWDADAASKKLEYLHDLRIPDNLLLGNVLGINPFKNIQPRLLVCQANSISKGLGAVINKSSFIDSSR